MRCLPPLLWYRFRSLWDLQPYPERLVVVTA